MLTGRLDVLRNCLGPTRGCMSVLVSTVHSTKFYQSVQCLVLHRTRGRSVGVADRHEDEPNSLLITDSLEKNRRLMVDSWWDVQ